MWEMFLMKFEASHLSCLIRSKKTFVAFSLGFGIELPKKGKFVNSNEKIDRLINPRAKQVPNWDLERFIKF